MFCLKCGYEMQEETSFCAKCGTKVIASDTVRQEISPVQQNVQQFQQQSEQQDRPLNQPPDSQPQHSQSPKVSGHATSQVETVFCRQCGQKIPWSATFCDKCGAPVKMIYTTSSTLENPTTQRPKGRTNNILFILGGIIAAIIVIGLLGGGDVDHIDIIGLLEGDGVDYIASVKNMSPSYISSATYEQLVEKCLKSPKWKEREGKEGSHYVDITGYSKPDGKKIEFTVRVDPTDDPEMLYYTPSKILIDGTGGGEDAASTFLLAMITVYESGDTETLIDTYYGLNLIGALL